MKSSLAAAARPLRIFAISDIHVDYGSNMEWVQNLSDTEFKDDILILAGDVAGELSSLTTTLQKLRSKFQEMFFVPGNHDGWAKYMKSRKIDSKDKFTEILKFCGENDVKTSPTRVGTGSDAVWIVPMLSWYHSEFDKEPDIHREPKYPDPSTTDEWSPARALQSGVLGFVDNLNDEALEKAQLTYEQIRADNLPIISFSHFVPRIELMPEKRFLYPYHNLAKGAGCLLLRPRIEKLKPDVHIFGHTHFAWDATLDGVRYISAAYGFPDQRKCRMDFFSIGNITERPVLIYDSSLKQNGGKGFVSRYECKASDYYKKNPRDPDNLETSSWMNE